MAVTIKDIAKIVGVSHTTVSRALNNSPYISEKTKITIKQVAEKYGYIPNTSAKSLVLQRSFNIGLFFSTLNLGVTSNFFFETVSAVQNLIKDDYKLIIRGIDDYKGDYFELNNKAFDGVILVSQAAQDDKLIEALIRKSIPSVIVNRNIGNVEIDSFYSNEREITKEATEYLIQHGHTKIAYVKGKEHSISTEERFSGFMDAVSANSIELQEGYISSGDYSIKSGYDAMNNILKLDPKPTAAFCTNDNMALGAVRCLHENNIKVPEEFSIIGFDNTEYSEYLVPALTTIDRPIHKIVEEATKRLLTLINADKDKEKTVIRKCFESEIIYRDSVK
jgi:DNA-binding LacI/PurR family transcriptional regulator